jgi:hypothetical protein
MVEEGGGVGRRKREGGRERGVEMGDENMEEAGKL